MRTTTGRGTGAARPRWRAWAPAVVVTALIGAVSLTAGAVASATPDLPEKTPEEILELVASSRVETFSGSFEQSSDLGLPALPDGAGPSGPPAGGGEDGLAGLVELLTASHEGRLWRDGHEKVRVQLHDRLGERNIIRNGPDLWTYDFSANEVTHTTLPEGGASAGEAPDPTDTFALPGPGDAEIPGPAAIAALAVAALEPSTEVTAPAPATVAGRAAYRLLLDPLSTDTLVDSITLAVDAETGMLLTVEVRAVGRAAPAFRAAFTSFSLDPPDPSLFEFTPPPGATVEELDPGSTPDIPSGDLEPRADALVPDGASTHGASTADEPRLVGTAWDAVVVLPAGDDVSGLLTDPTFGPLLHDVPGGKALTTALLTVLVTDDGRVLAGAVTLERLQTVAAEAA